MENINVIISQNLKRYRAEKKLSLDSLAKLTGVSKSMLGQIERGDVNPTISTVWKITNGLKISFSALMNCPETAYELTHTQEIDPLLEDDGKYRNYPLFLFDSNRRFETYYIEIDSTSRLDSEPHPSGTQEFITVFDGTLTVEIDQKTFHLTAGNALRFTADHAHSYCSTGTTPCRIHMVIYYPQTES